MGHLRLKHKAVIIDMILEIYTQIILHLLGGVGVFFKGLFFFSFFFAWCHETALLSVHTCVVPNPEPELGL